MAKNIFITGGAGFIGSWIVEKLVADGHAITVYDNFSSGLKENIAPFQDKITLIEGDILDRKPLTEAMKGHDTIIHQAAQLEITTAIDDPSIDVKQNIIGSLNVINGAQEQGIKKLIVASSGCVYGQVSTPPVKETDEQRPNWEYGVSKWAVEKYCDIFADYDDMQFANLRYGIVYGEREWYGRVLTIFLKRALTGEPLVIFGEGVAERDFVHVEDVAEFNRVLVNSDWKGNEVFNVSTGKATNIKQLAEIVQDVVKEVDGTELEVIHETLEEGQVSQHVEGRLRLPRELGIMHLDNTKAKGMGWDTTVDVREGVKREYLWLKDNVDRWHTLSY